MLLNFYYENKSKFVYLFLLSFLIISQSLTSAQSGTVHGTVTDKNSNEALVGANVIINGTSLGAATDLDGNYVINNVSAGEQVLVVSYVGYKEARVTVKVTAKKTYEINIKLEAQAVEANTVYVTAQAKGQLQAINEQLASNTIINVVSAEKMQELPDANLAESIGRLPGISIQMNAGEATKLVIRGLSPQYNNVTIEGVPMVSTSNSDRSIDLSLLTDNLVKGVEVSKSLRADMDAEALGGTVNLTLRQAPENFHYNVQALGSYTDLGQSMNNAKLTAGISDRFFDNKFGVMLQGSWEQKFIPEQTFGGTYGQLYSSNTNTNYLQTQDATLTDENINRQRSGLMAVFDYKSDFMDMTFLNMFSQINDNYTIAANSFNFIDASTNSDDAYSRQYNIENYVTEERTHSIQNNFRFLGTTLSTSLSWTKANYSNPGQYFPFDQIAGGAQQKIPLSHLNYAQPSAVITAMGPSNIAYTFFENAYMTDSYLNENDYDLKADYKVPFNFSDYFSGTISLGGKFNQKDRVSNGSGTYYDIQYGGSGNREAAFEKLFPWVKWETQAVSPIFASNFIQTDYVPPTFLKGQYKLDWSANMGELVNMQNIMWKAFGPSGAGTYFQDGGDDYNSTYNAYEAELADYIMGEFNIGRSLTIVPGIRYEQERTDYSAYQMYENNSNADGLGGASRLQNVQKFNDFYFPSLNVKYKVNDNIQVMGAFYKSCTRPNYSDLSPDVNYPASGNLNQSANPGLTPSTAWNGDLGVSFSNNALGLFTVNAFYKEISNLVYYMPDYQPYLDSNPSEVIAPQSILNNLPGLAYYDTSWFHNNKNSSVTLPVNCPNLAYVRGIELSWQTHLWYLPSVLSGLVLDLNISFMNSQMQYPYFAQDSVGFVKSGFGTTTVYKYKYYTRSAPVINQPNETYNAIIGWDYLGFSARVSFRYQGQTLTGLDARYSLQDAYFGNLWITDISLSQKFLDKFTVYANLTNVNDHIDTYYISSSYGPLPTSDQSYGFRAFLGLSVNL